MFTCAECCRRRDVVHLIRRLGGGSYRTPARWYRRHVCTGCILDMADAVDATPEGQSRPDKIYMHSVRDVMGVAERIRQEENR